MNKSHIIAEQVLSKMAREVFAEDQADDSLEMKRAAIRWGMNLVPSRTEIILQPKGRKQ